MLKLNDDFILYVLSSEKGYETILTTSDIKKKVKERTKIEGKEVFFADVVQEYTLVGMDERGNGYYV